MPDHVVDDSGHSFQASRTVSVGPVLVHPSATSCFGIIRTNASSDSATLDNSGAGGSDSSQPLHFDGSSSVSFFSDPNGPPGGGSKVSSPADQQQCASSISAFSDMMKERPSGAPPPEPPASSLAALSAHKPPDQSPPPADQRAVRFAGGSSISFFTAAEANSSAETETGQPRPSLGTRMNTMPLPAAPQRFSRTSSSASLPGEVAPYSASVTFGGGGSSDGGSMNCGSFGSSMNTRSRILRSQHTVR